MKSPSPDKIRNVALLAHGDAGKTTLAEAILFAGGAVPRMGSVEDGTAALDYTESEKKRQITINLGIGHCDWKGTKLNILDCPGYADFYGDVKAGLRVSDCAIVLLAASSGIEVGTDLVWQFLETAGLPRMICVNKMDKEHANFRKCLEDAGEGLVGREPLGQDAERELGVAWRQALHVGGRVAVDEDAADAGVLGERRVEGLALLVGVGLARRDWREDGGDGDFAGLEALGEASDHRRVGFGLGSQSKDEHRAAPAHAGSERSGEPSGDDVVEGVRGGAVEGAWAARAARRVEDSEQDECRGEQRGGWRSPARAGLHSDDGIDQRGCKGDDDQVGQW